MMSWTCRRKMTKIRRQVFIQTDVDVDFVEAKLPQQSQGIRILRPIMKVSNIRPSPSSEIVEGITSVRKMFKSEKHIYIQPDFNEAESPELPPGIRILRPIMRVSKPNIRLIPEYVEATATSPSKIRMIKRQVFIQAKPPRVLCEEIRALRPMMKVESGYRKFRNGKPVESPLTITKIIMDPEDFQERRIYLESFFKSILNKQQQDTKA